jgi:hypothetical protein
MEIGKICPFRSSEVVEGSCNSKCQLFLPSRVPEEGKCALAFVPLLKQEIASLTNAIVNISRAMPGR